jgi:hypothetical protein
MRFHHGKIKLWCHLYAHCLFLIGYCSNLGMASRKRTGSEVNRPDDGSRLKTTNGACGAGAGCVIAAPSAAAPQAVAAAQAVKPAVAAAVPQAVAAAVPPAVAAAVPPAVPAVPVAIPPAVPPPLVIPAVQGLRGGRSPLNLSSGYDQTPPPYDLMDVHESKVTKWEVFHNFIGKFWCFVVDPARGHNLYVMVTMSGGTVNGGMQWMGKVLTSALDTSFWPPDQIWDSEFTFLLPMRSAISKYGFLQLATDKFMGCQVRATSKEMTDYAKKLFISATTTTPDYHLLRPFFHHLLENVTDEQDRKDRLSEFLRCWPCNVCI